jgi:hypothetical protein
MKRTYSEDQQEYFRLINLKTIEGYTPLIISIINFSHDAMELFLGYGGVDISLIEAKKMDAYEIAVNYENQ